MNSFDNLMADDRQQQIEYERVFLEGERLALSGQKTD